MVAKIVTGRERYGAKYAAKFPRKAGHLWVRITTGQRRKFKYVGPPTPENIERAARLQEKYERAAEFANSPEGRTLDPTFAVIARAYLDSGVKLDRIAESTQEDRFYQLAPNGPVVRVLGDLHPEEFNTPALLGWWQGFVIDGERTVKTGRNYLDAISAAFRYAILRGQVEANPVDAFRSTSHALNRTKASRADASAHKATPIEPYAKLAEFVEVSAQWHRCGRPSRKLTGLEQTQLEDVHIANMLQLDAGLRLGEAFELRWSSIYLGEDANDASRRIEVVEARARGKYRGAPKSGAVAHGVDVPAAAIAAARAAHPARPSRRPRAGPGALRPGGPTGPATSRGPAPKQSSVIASRRTCAIRSRSTF